MAEAPLTQGILLPAVGWWQGAFAQSALVLPVVVLHQ